MFDHSIRLPPVCASQHLFKSISMLGEAKQIGPKYGSELITSDASREDALNELPIGCNLAKLTFVLVDCHRWKPFSAMIAPDWVRKCRWLIIAIGASFTWVGTTVAMMNNFHGLWSSLEHMVLLIWLWLMIYIIAARVPDICVHVDIDDWRLLSMLEDGEEGEE